MALKFNCDTYECVHTLEDQPTPSPTFSPPTQTPTLTPTLRPQFGSVRLLSIFPRRRLREEG
jgi:hypothetical protein